MAKSKSALFCRKYSVNDWCYVSMQKHSLPKVLQIALQQHVAASDIANDDELQEILNKLSELHLKVQEAKQRAIIKRQSKE